MDNIERIEYMEKILNEGQAAVSALSEALARYTALAPRLSELFDYYGSPLWFSDLADDEAGNLPEDLARGVLSEDAVYNLIDENRQLLEEVSGFVRHGQALFEAVGGGGIRYNKLRETLQALRHIQFQNVLNTNKYDENQTENGMLLRKNTKNDQDAD